MSLTVLQISQNYTMYGGSDKYQLEWSSLLEQRGHSVIPFAARDDRNYSTPWEMYFPPGVNFEQPGIHDLIRYVYSVPAANAMTRLLREQHVDIAHLHIYYGKLTASILSPLKEKKVPLVQTVHDYKLLCPVYTLYAHGSICEKCKGRYFYNVLLNRCNRNSLQRSFLSMIESYVSKLFGAVSNVDHFIAVSDFVKTKLIESGISKDKVTTVHNYVDSAQCETCQQTGEYIVYFGRLEKNKGIYTLLEAAKLIPDVELYVAGSGCEEENVKEIVRKEGLKNVHLSGYLGKDELDKLLDKAICTVLPSEWNEPFGLTITESFAKSVPVIVSSMGGMPEIVADGVDGSIVEPGNSIMLAECMHWYWDHRELAGAMGEKGRKKVLKTFTPRLHYEKVMDIYEFLLSSR